MQLLNLKNALFLTLGILFSIKTSGQSDKKEKQGISILTGFQPIYLINKTVKLDIELKPSKNRFSYIISPEWFKGTVHDKSLMTVRSRPSDEINGFGIQLQQKYALQKKQAGGAYLSYGAAYRHNVISYKNIGFFSYKKENLTYYEYGPYENKLKINTLLFNAVTGVQFVENFIVYDFYTGFGYKLSTKDTNYPNDRKYNQSFSSYAYEGLIFNLGFKIGLKLK